MHNYYSSSTKSSIGDSLLLSQLFLIIATVIIVVIKGVGNIFKELTPHSPIYEIRGQGKKSIENQDKKKHRTLSYKNYLQN